MRRALFALSLLSCAPLESSPHCFTLAFRSTHPATILDAIPLPDASIAILTFDGHAIRVSALSPDGDTRWHSPILAETRDPSSAYGRLRADSHGNLFAGGVFDRIAYTPWLARIAADGSTTHAPTSDLPPAILSLAPTDDKLVASVYVGVDRCRGGGRLFAYESDLTTLWSHLAPADGCYRDLTRVADELVAFVFTPSIDGGPVLLDRLTTEGVTIASKTIGNYCLDRGNEPTTLLALDDRVVLAGWLGTPCTQITGAWIEARSPDLTTLWRDELPSDVPISVTAAVDTAAGLAHLIIGETPADADTALRVRTYDAADGTLLCDEHLDTWPATEDMHAVVATDGALWLLGADPNALSSPHDGVPVARFTASLDPD